MQDKKKIIAKVQPTVTFELHLTLTESEARALNALTLYGMEKFLDTFYRNLGTHYLQPHEAGLKNLFLAIRNEIPPVLQATDDMRKQIEMLRTKNFPQTP